jgi:hypothetical protein
LKIIDHISIYFLIAGTYTPFLLVYLNNGFGITLLAILWGLTAAGIVFKIFFTGRFEIVSTILYLAMGLIMVVGGRKFFDHLPGPVMLFVIIGSALYCSGGDDEHVRGASGEQVFVTGNSFYMAAVFFILFLLMNCYNFPPFKIQWIMSKVVNTNIQV